MIANPFKRVSLSWHLESNLSTVSLNGRQYKVNNNVSKLSHFYKYCQVCMPKFVFCSFHILRVSEDWQDTLKALYFLFVQSSVVLYAFSLIVNAIFHICVVLSLTARSPAVCCSIWHSLVLQQKNGESRFAFWRFKFILLYFTVRKQCSNTVDENSGVFLIQMRWLPSVVKLYPNKILQFLTGDAS